MKAYSSAARSPALDSGIQIHGSVPRLYARMIHAGPHRRIRLLWKSTLFVQKNGHWRILASDFFSFERTKDVFPISLDGEISPG
jgi:hypothetical protein